jgi:preprotein translocase subunit SecA
VLPADRSYPERDDRGSSHWFERASERVVGRMARWLRARPRYMHGFLPWVALREAEFRAADDVHLVAVATELRRELRRDGLCNRHAGAAFALVREVAGRKLGMRHHDNQLMGGWSMLQGMIAEMETGEGKTLTATLPAATAAMAGHRVHVVTVNDYLVGRDHALMQPVYEALGLSTAAITAEMDPLQRQQAYRADVVYVTNKILVFDYLRDRVALGGAADPLRLTIDRMVGGASVAGKLLLQGLDFAIVDEADSVLVDEARTPLIISDERPGGEEAAIAHQALSVGRQLQLGTDFLLTGTERRVTLTEAGRTRLLDVARPLGGGWLMALRREELAVRALTALHLFQRDEHYLVRDGKVHVIDEYTGRVMADRSWGQGLHQMIEAKEGCDITGVKDVLAKISYQRFFRRYLHLAGMSGTVAEVAGELGDVYRLAVMRVPSHRPNRRIVCTDRVLDTADAKWRIIVERVRALHRQGVPVLIGTRTVAVAEEASRRLSAEGLDHQVLSARQDGEEAGIVSLAGQKSAITVATNMAGRGTDIKLAEGVDALGGLCVLLAERHDAARIDRQLAGRCARQGDAGRVEGYLSLEDALMLPLAERFETLLIRRVSESSSVGQWLRRKLVRLAQRRMERSAYHARQGLLKSDRQMGDVLAFSGRPE